VLKVPPSEAAAYKREIDAAFGGRSLMQTGVPAGTMFAHSALELMQTTEKIGIVTFCKELDSLLLGGIPLGEVTEICA
jgi:RecA/RadA recombinase